MKVFVKQSITPEIKANILKSVQCNPNALSRDVICDFCGRANPTYVYAAERTQAGMEIPCWRWCACDHCAMYVDKNDWTSLRRRIVRNLWRRVLGIIPDNLMLQENGALVEDAVNTALRAFFRDAVQEEGTVSKETDIKVACINFNAHVEVCLTCSGPGICERGMELLNVFQQALNDYISYRGQAA